MTRVLRKGERDDGKFDIEFWQSLGAEAIFSAAHDMVKEVEYFRGVHGEPRLQRHIVRIVRRGG